MLKGSQTEVQPPAIEQLKRAFGKIPGLTAYDANKYCQETFGMIARNFEVQVLGDVGIEIELSLLDQLHDCRRGEQFRNRTGSE